MHQLIYASLLLLLLLEAIMFYYIQDALSVHKFHAHSKKISSKEKFKCYLHKSQKIYISLL